MAMNFNFNPSAMEFNPGAMEFTPGGLAELNPEASAFTPTTPKEDPPAYKIYAIKELLQLRENCKTLPPDVKVPDMYSAFSKKKKNPRKGSRYRNNSPRGGFRAANIFESSAILAPTENSFLKKMKQEADEVEKQARKIRSTLNKLSESNFEKLSSTLATEFEYDRPLIVKLVDFIFDRATAFNFPELYAKLCRFLTRHFKKQDPQQAKDFRTQLLAKCEDCFYREDEPMADDGLMDAEYKRRRRLLGNIKFIGLLYRYGMLKASIMFECFDVLLKAETLCDETLETCCHLFQESAKLLAVKHSQELEDYFSFVTSFRNNDKFSKRVQFLVQDIIEIKNQLFTPENGSYSPTKSKPVPKGVFFQDLEEEKTPQDKEIVHSSIRGYLSDSDDQTTIKELLGVFGGKDTQTQTGLFVQVFKYTLLEHNKEEEFTAVCELVKRLSEQMPLETLEDSLEEVKKQLPDIKLDSPHAEKFFIHIINTLEELCLVTNTHQLRTFT